MIRAIVVDDEPLSRRNVTALLQDDRDIELVAECGSGAEAIDVVRELAPELLFLDVSMPEIDGFDVLELLGAAAPPVVVFVTAHDKHAVRAFEAGALDYLLKPFDRSRFDLALSRAKMRITNYSVASRYPETIAVKSIGGVEFLRVAEIDWIEAADYYARIHIGKATHLLRRSLADLEGELDPAQFCRIHRSAIVRLDRISGLELNAQGEYDVRLSSSASLRLSRRYRRTLQASLRLLN